jgi:hypothetical protein
MQRPSGLARRGEVGALDARPVALEGDRITAPGKALGEAGGIGQVAQRTAEEGGELGGREGPVAPQAVVEGGLDRLAMQIELAQRIGPDDLELQGHFGTAGEDQGQMT